MLVCGMMALTACGTAYFSAPNFGEENKESIGSTGEVTGEVTGENISENISEDAGENAEAVNVLDVSEMFTDRDLNGTYKASEAVKIEVNEDSVQCSSKAVQVDGSIITITGEGIYLLSGNLTNGSIVIAADENKAKVQLVLNGVRINNDTGAAIYVKSCDKLFVTLAEGSENTLSNGGSYQVLDENNIDGVVFSKSDICINGSGNLTITAKAGHGVVAKDDLKITGGNLVVNAEEGHGVSAKDSVRIKAGNLKITAGKDGIHANHAEDTSKGYVYLGGGMLEIVSGGDGISASGMIQADAVELNILTGGGSANKTVAKDENGESVSAKGIKASQDVVLNDGMFVIDSQDDALHSNTNLTVNGGTYQVSTQDDGIHGDETTTIAGGKICILTSYEGIEGNKIYVTGGYVEMVAGDDGMNAAGGNDGGMGGAFGGDMFGGNSDSTIDISGGTIYMNAGGDGLDSNGSLIVTGGAVYISGPTNGANGALDYTTTGQVAGGIVVALGNSQMAMNFDESSTQGSVLLSTSGNAGAGTEILVKDAEGNVLIEYVAESAFNSILLTSPALQIGETYTFSIGGSELEMTLETLINGSGNGMGGPGGMPGGRPGGMGGPGGGRPGGDRRY